MRKIALLIAAVAFMAATDAYAQPALAKGNESKALSAVDLKEGFYAGQYGKLDCWVTEGRKHQKHLQMVNLNLEVMYDAELPKSGDCRVLAAGMGTQRAGVLVVDQSEKRRTVVGSYAVALDSAKAVGNRMDTVVSFDYGKKDECLVWGASSPSGNYVAVVAVVRYNEDMRYRTYIALFDGEMNKQWSQEFALGTLSQLVVTDDGRVVTLGLEAGAEEQCFVVNLLTQDNARSNKIFVRCDPVRDLTLAAVNGPYMLAVGSYGPAGGKKYDHITLGTFALAFNLDSAVMTGFNMHPFSNEDINILYNKKTKKIQTQLFCENFGRVGVTPTPYGCAALYGRKVRLEYTNTTGTRQSDYQIVGLLCMAVDTVGHIKWVRNLRCNDVQEGSDAMVGATILMANDKLSIIKSEHKKYPAAYDIAKEAKQFDIGSKANIVMYTFGETGNVQKMLIEKATKQNLIRTLLRRDGSLLMLSSNGSKQRAADLRFVY